MSIPFLTMFAAQIDKVVDSVPTDDTPRSRVKASPEQRAYGLQQARAAGLKPLSDAGWTLKQLDAALDTAFPAGNPTSLRRRMEMKSNLYAGGLILEAPDQTEKRNLVVAGLMARKAGLPLPTDKPYSMSEFDAIMAGKPEISIAHRLEIKQAFLKAGLLADSDKRRIQAQAAPRNAAKAICDALGLDGGKKLTVPAVDRAMADRGWDQARRVHAKSTLAGAGII